MKVVDTATLISAYTKAKSFDPIALTPRLAEMASDSNEILKALVQTIRSPQERRRKVMGSMKHAWVPAIYLLDKGNAQVVALVVHTINSVWTVDERMDFYDYTKGVASLSAAINNLELE